MYQTDASVGRNLVRIAHVVVFRGFALVLYCTALPNRLRYSAVRGEPMVSVVQAVCWYALRVRPRLELVASRHLRAKGYEEYLPTRKVFRHWTDRVNTVEIPLFPGYMFCRFDDQYRLPILVTPGVLSIVRLGNRPTPLADIEISSIQQAAVSGLPCESLSSIPVGEPVSVTRGPLAGLSGTLVEIKSRLRLIIALPLLQRSLAVEIDSDCVERERPTAMSARPSHRLR
jgi:transcription antitermination factor NusG